MVFTPFPATEPPPEVAHCEGGMELGTQEHPLCYFDDFGSETANNSFAHNGFFKNKSNGDIGNLSQAGPNFNADSNCFHGNKDLEGALTSDPSNIDNDNECGKTYPPMNDPVLTAQVACDSGLLGECPKNEASNYPRQEKVSLSLPPAQTTLPNPCANVPENPWCVGGVPAVRARGAHRKR
jgi:hypothetical protein